MTLTHAFARGPTFKPSLFPPTVTPPAPAASHFLPPSSLGDHDTVQKAAYICQASAFIQPMTHFASVIILLLHLATPLSGAATPFKHLLPVAFTVPHHLIPPWDPNPLPPISLVTSYVISRSAQCGFCHPELTAADSSTFTRGSFHISSIYMAFVNTLFAFCLVRLG